MDTGISEDVKEWLNVGETSQDDGIRHYGDDLVRECLVEDLEARCRETNAVPMFLIDMEGSLDMDDDEYERLLSALRVLPVKYVDFDHELHPDLRHALRDNPHDPIAVLHGCDDLEVEDIQALPRNCELHYFELLRGVRYEAARQAFQANPLHYVSMIYNHIDAISLLTGHPTLKELELVVVDFIDENPLQRIDISTLPNLTKFTMKFESDNRIDRDLVQRWIKHYQQGFSANPSAEVFCFDWKWSSWSKGDVATFCTLLQGLPAGRKWELQLGSNNENVVEDLMMEAPGWTNFRVTEFKSNDKPRWRIYVCGEMPGAGFDRPISCGDFTVKDVSSKLLDSIKLPPRIREFHCADWNVRGGEPHHLLDFLRRHYFLKRVTVDGGLQAQADMFVERNVKLHGALLEKVESKPQHLPELLAQASPKWIFHCIARIVTRDSTTGRNHKHDGLYGTIVAMDSFIAVHYQLAMVLLIDLGDMLMLVLLLGYILLNIIQGIFLRAFRP